MSFIEANESSNTTDNGSVQTMYNVSLNAEQYNALMSLLRTLENANKPELGAEKESAPASSATDKVPPKKLQRFILDLEAPTSVTGPFRLISKKQNEYNLVRHQSYNKSKIIVFEFDRLEDNPKAAYKTIERHIKKLLDDSVKELTDSLKQDIAYTNTDKMAKANEIKSIKYRRGALRMIKSRITLNKMTVEEFFASIAHMGTRRTPTATKKPAATKKSKPEVEQEDRVEQVKLIDFERPSTTVTEIETESKTEEQTAAPEPELEPEPEIEEPEPEPEPEPEIEEPASDQEDMQVDLDGDASDYEDYM